MSSFSNAVDPFLSQRVIKFNYEIQVKVSEAGSLDKESGTK